MLCGEGLIVRRSGAGSFIAADPPEMRTVQVASGSWISARPATPDDFLGNVEQIPPGVPALVVEVPGHAAKVYPADRTRIIVLSDNGHGVS